MVLVWVLTLLCTRCLGIKKFDSEEEDLIIQSFPLEASEQMIIEEQIKDSVTAYGLARLKGFFAPLLKSCSSLMGLSPFICRCFFLVARLAEMIRMVSGSLR